MLPELHQRGVELVVELLDAIDDIERLDTEEVRALLKETAFVLGEVLKRDVPRELRDADDSGLGAGHALPKMPPL
ncbi:hypothetical protein SAZ10_32055 [Mesorhizobium sp. BAC0120]|uniref:hypothetical protein n=1 Tax=Mesorhizobium sp. BAC0120 TaxID=3090670 RepID=UPI00298C7B32|nr:hypothetical protein [Mesorhizobium sp. BAC0120]MDW6026404.1 hypothetical protein [Mesorhizobium sp. BAC0120]